MSENITFQDLEKNCPLGCPFLRKLPDKHVYLCTEYRKFLELDKYGMPRRNSQCGVQEVDNAVSVLKSMASNIDLWGPYVLSLDDKQLLNNIMCVLDNSERMVLAFILENQHTAKSFMNTFARQPKDSDLVMNTRAVIREYEEKYLDKDELKKRKTQALSKQSKSSEKQMEDDNLKLQLLLKQKEKNEYSK